MAQTITINITPRARALVSAELTRASEHLTLDLAEMRERRAGPGVIALIEDALTAVADMREQLKG